MKKMNVGADASVRPQTQKGITLIALIITIIVMLILVGVTINIAINGGLFDTARDAGTGMQKAVEEEELMSVAISAYSARNDSVTVSELTSAIDTEKFEYDSEKSNEDKYVVKGKKSGTIWQIDLKTAEVTEYKEVPSIYKIAYEYSNSNGGLTVTHKMFFLNNETMYYVLTYSGSMSMKIGGYMQTDISQYSFSDDYSSFTTMMDGENVTFAKTSETFTYSPEEYNDTGIYTNALYTQDGTLTLAPYNIQVCGQNMYRCGPQELPVGEYIDTTSHPNISVENKSLIWTDGNTYYLVEDI